MLPLALLVVLLVLVATLRRRNAAVDGWLSRVLQAPLPCGESRLDRLAPFVGFGLLVVALGALELRQPYYFSQDDVRVGELPGMLIGCRALWSGHFPDYQPWVLLGTPLASLAGASLTYPPTYVAYAIARHVLHDEYALADVFAWLHLTAGFGLTFLALRRNGASRVLATVFALSFVLSGASLTMGRSWHMAAAAIAWFPAFGWLALKLRDGARGGRWTIATGLAIGVSHHVGFPQMWVYEVGVFVTLVAWFLLTSAISWRRAAWLVPALLLGAAIAAPLMWVVMDNVRDMQRVGGYGAGIGVGLWSMLVPVPLVRSPHPNGWGGGEIASIGTLYYLGAIVVLAALSSLVALVTRWPERAARSRSVFTLLPLVLLFLALGPETPLWGAVSRLPIFSIVSNHPFRLLTPMAFLLCVGAGVTVTALVSRSARPRRWEGVVVAAVLVPLVVHVYSARAAFYDYGFVPYAPLGAPATALLLPADPTQRGRVLPVAPARSPDSSYAHSFEHALPAIYGIPSFGGYDPVSETRAPYRAVLAGLARDPTATLRAWGVRWIVVHRTVAKPIYTPSPTPKVPDLERFVRWLPALQRTERAALGGALKTNELEIYELAGAEPLAQWDVRPGERASLPIAFRDDGVEVDLPGDGGPRTVTIALLRWPRTVVTADGAVVAAVADRWGRIEVEVPRGARRLRVGVAPPWRAGLGVGAVLALVACAMGWVARKLQLGAPLR
jgi:hypothetical protein